MASTLSSRLIAPDVCASVGEAGYFTELGNMARGLAPAVRARHPHKVLRTKGPIRHPAKLSRREAGHLVPSAQGLEAAAEPGISRCPRLPLPDSRDPGPPAPSGRCSHQHRSRSVGIRRRGLVGAMRSAAAGGSMPSRRRRRQPSRSRPKCSSVTPPFRRQSARGAPPARRTPPPRGRSSHR